MTLSATSSLHERPPSPRRRTERVGRSAIQVDRVGGRSRLVRSVSQDPLKLIPTRSGDDACCSVVLSNYGGGFLQGDDVHLTVDCSEDTRLYLGTQALNKVYRCPTGEARQVIEGRLERDAVVASLPDPVMLFGEARFRQRQTWSLKENAVLAIADGMVSGRRAMGESFAFSSYTSESRVFRGGRPAAIESVRCDPDKLKPERDAVFGRYHVVFTLMVVGTPKEDRYESCCGRMETSAGACFHEDVTAVFARPKPDVGIVRVLGASLAAADEIIRKLNGDVAECLLKFNPISRKA